MLQIYHLDETDISQNNIVCKNKSQIANRMGLINLKLYDGWSHSHDCKSLFVYNNYIQIPPNHLTTKKYYKSLATLIQHYILESYQTQIHQYMFCTQEEYNKLIYSLHHVLYFIIFIRLFFTQHIDITKDVLVNLMYTLFKSKDLYRSVELIVDLNNNSEMFYELLEDDIYLIAKPIFNTQLERTTRIINCLEFIFNNNLIDIMNNPNIKNNRMLAIIPIKNIGDEIYYEIPIVLMDTKYELNNNELIFNITDENNNKINIKKISLNIGLI
jgi:hypothetical protein